MRIHTRPLRYPTRAMPDNHFVNQGISSLV